jgi:4-hydroxyproline epimerase
MRLEVPAGMVEAHYTCDDGGRVVDVKIRNVASYLHSIGLAVDVPDLGRVTFDVAYGGNFYAIIDPQEAYSGLDSLTALDIQRLSPVIRRLINEAYAFVHPEDASISGLRHVMWTGPARHPEAAGRNAVFYGEKAIDRSPCGTGTSARMAQLVGHGRLAIDDTFVHESIIGSLFRGRVEAETTVGDYPAIIPSIAGQAWVTGHNTIFLDDRDPFVEGFTVS